MKTPKEIFELANILFDNEVIVIRKGNIEDDNCTFIAEDTEGNQLICGTCKINWGSLTAYPKYGYRDVTEDDIGNTVYCSDFGKDTQIEKWPSGTLLAILPEKYSHRYIVGGTTGEEDMHESCKKAKIGFLIDDDTLVKEEVFEHKGKKYRKACEEDIGEYVYYSNLGFDSAMNNSDPKVLDDYDEEILRPYCVGNGVWYKYAYVKLEDK